MCNEKPGYIFCTLGHLYGGCHLLTLTESAFCAFSYRNAKGYRVSFSKIIVGKHRLELHAWKSPPQIYLIEVCLSRVGVSRTVIGHLSASGKGSRFGYC
jgi:hypothetical protein